MYYRRDGRFPPPPPATFETSRLLLRSPRPEDDEEISSYARDPIVMRLVDWPKHTEVATSHQLLEFCAKGRGSGLELTWLLTLEPSDRAVVAIGCRPAPPPSS